MAAAAPSTSRTSSVWQKVRGAHQRHGDRLLRLYLQRALGGEARHRLAHRHDRNAERLGHRAQRQLVPRREAAADEPVGKVAIDAIGQRAGRGLELLLIGGNVQHGILRPATGQGGRVGSC
jgi:hypothetical protein